MHQALSDRKLDGRKDMAPFVSRLPERANVLLAIFVCDLSFVLWLSCPLVIFSVYYLNFGVVVWY